MSQKSFALLGLSAGILCSTAVSPQSSQESAATPKFEVASITRCKANDDAASGGRGGGTGGRAIGDPGRLRLECRPLENLVRLAHIRFATGHDARVGAAAASVLRKLQAQPIDGGPSWVRSDLYTIDAKPETPQTLAMMQGPMLQALLEDRFHLKIRRVTKDVPVYALVTAKGGAKLEPAKTDACTVLDFTKGPPPIPSPDQPPPCGTFRASKNGIETRGQTLTGLVRQFSAALDRDVVDRTGLDGTFDINLDLTDEELFPFHRRDTPTDAGDPASTPPAPDSLGAIMRAVAKLGLRLEPAKASGEFFSIDHAERPTEN